MAFMIAANKQGRIAKPDWRLAFFALGPTPGNTFNLLQTKIVYLYLLTQCAITDHWHGIK
jgi:hypothetical protein